MPISTNEVEQQEGKKFVVRGVIEHHNAGELCSEGDLLTLGKVKLERTRGGGIAYEVEIYLKRPSPARESVPARNSAAA